MSTYKPPLPSSEAQDFADIWKEINAMPDSPKREKARDALYKTYSKVMESFDQPIDKSRSPLDVAVGGMLEAMDYGPGLVRTAAALPTGKVTMEDIKNAILPNLQPAVSFSEVAERLGIPRGPEYKGISARGVGTFLADVLASPAILSSLGKKAFTSRAAQAAKRESVPSDIRGIALPERPSTYGELKEIVPGIETPQMRMSPEQLPGPQIALPPTKAIGELDIPRPYSPEQAALEYKTIAPPPPLPPEIRGPRAVGEISSPPERGLPYRETPKRVAGEILGEGTSKARSKYGEMWDMEEMVSEPKVSSVNAPPKFLSPGELQKKNVWLDRLTRGAQFAQEPLPPTASTLAKKTYSWSYKDADLATVFANKTPFTDIAEKYNFIGEPQKAAKWAAKQIEDLSREDLRYYVRLGIHEGRKKGMQMGISGAKVIEPVLEDLSVQMRIAGSSEIAAKVKRELQSELLSSRVATVGDRGLDLSRELDLGELLTMKRATQKQASKYGAYASEGKSATAKRSLTDQMTGDAYAGIARRADDAIVSLLEKADPTSATMYKGINGDISSLMTALPELEKAAHRTFSSRLREVSLPAMVGATAGYAPFFALPGAAKAVAIPAAIAGGFLGASPTVQTTLGLFGRKAGPPLAHGIRAGGIESLASEVRPTDWDILRRKAEKYERQNQR